MLIFPPPSEVVIQRTVLLWYVLTVLGQVWSFIFCLWCLRSTWGIAFLVTYFMYVAGPGRTACETGAWPTPLRRWSLWHHFRDYFSAQLVRTVPLDPSCNYVFVLHPHGVAALSAWINFATEATGFGTLFPGLSIHAATLAGNFRLPFIREYCQCHGLIPASKRALTNTLRRAPGVSVLLAVGGAAESLRAAPGTFDLVLLRRKGFVRLALETGAALVPVLCFGENDAYDTFIPPPKSTAAKCLRMMRKVFGFATPIFWGTGILGGVGLLPKQVRLTTVVGAPIVLPKVLRSPDRSSRWDSGGAAVSSSQDGTSKAAVAAVAAAPAVACGAGDFTGQEEIDGCSAKLPAPRPNEATGNGSSHVIAEAVRHEDLMDATGLQDPCPTSATAATADPGDESFDALVDRYHAQYVTALQELWKQHYSKYESPVTKELCIVE